MGLILSLDNSIHSFNRAGFVGLLDEYTGAAAGYSLRRLSVNSTNVIRVRRSSDNAEADFTATEITDGTLLSWVGNTASDNGFVTTWYDQSGNGNDATQATAASQPKIVDAGVLVTENGEAAVDFDGTDDYFIYTGLAFTNGAMSIWSVRKMDVISLNDGGIFDAATNQAFAIANGFRFDNFTGSARIGTAQSFTTFANNSVVQQVQSGYATSTIRKLFLDGVEVASDSGSYEADFTGVLQHKIGAMTSGTDQFATSNNFEGTIQEIVVYNSDQSTNRSGIEANINNHYNIYP